MGLNWPGISNIGGDLPEERQTAVRSLLDDLGDRVIAGLDSVGLPQAASPLFRPWNLVVVVDAEKVMAMFTVLQGGLAMIRWIAREGEILPAQALIRQVALELGSPVVASFVFPKGIGDGDQRAQAIDAVATVHLQEIERATRLGRLGDLSGLHHLEPGLRLFLDDHPDPERNVFIMMRFLETDQMQMIHQAITAELAERGYHGVRADDRDYTGELWSNIEVYMVGCNLGIAVFEDIEQREFNPNVSLELGYMLGRQKRCLLLKERRLPDLPADVVHRLYKPFDAFNIEETVRAQIGRWIEVDLGVA